MLCLNFKVGTKFIITAPGILHDHEIHCTVSERHGNYVQIAFDAVPEVRVYREEVWESVLEQRAAIAAANEAALHAPVVGGGGWNDGRDGHNEQLKPGPNNCRPDVTVD